MFCAMILVVSQNPAWWPMYGRDLANTHFSPLRGSMSAPPDIVWAYGGASFPENALSVAQFDADPQLEVVVASYGTGQVALVDGISGLAQWLVSTGGAHILGQPALEDLNADGTLDIVITHQFTGGIEALSGLNGSVLWSRPSTVISGYPSPKIIDIDQDGNLEVIVGSANDTLYWLNAATGATERALWLQGDCDVAPAIADVDEDGRWEIAISSTSALFLLNGEDGSVLWTNPAAGGHYSMPTIIDANGDGHLDVIHHSDAGRVYCVDRNGTTLWSTYIGASYPSQPAGTASADIDGDGVVEIVAGTDNPGDSVFCLNGITGAVEWRWPVPGGCGVHRSPSLADVNGDNLVEILVPAPGVNPHPLWCLRSDGTLLWSVNLSSGDIHDPSNADVDGDGCAELLVGTTNGVDAAFLLDDTDGASGCGLLAYEDYGIPGFAGPAIVFGPDGIILSISRRTEGSLSIYDTGGRRMSVLFSGTLEPGKYAFRPEGLSVGIYIAVFEHKQGVASCVLPVVR
ncbi:MAG: FG-GAP-like repeat-containing protein [candidate division WOR-3 bacterium]